MTIENSLYGPAWVKCGCCGTIAPLATLVDANKGGKGAVWACVNEPRCATWKAQNAAERAEFERAHPLLTVRLGGAFVRVVNPGEVMGTPTASGQAGPAPTPMPPPKARR